MEKYTYFTLRNANRDIRLLKLLPGPRGSPCVGCLRHGPLGDSTPDYAALSYTWGEPVKSQSLTISNEKAERHTLPITQNLQDALDHIRDEKESQMLWVDAVCIDQNNVPERSQQVRQMPKIFQKASNIVVWLGLASDDSDIAIRNIQALSMIDWEGENLPLCPWFYRAWIRQEIAAAKPKRCIVKCGDMECLLDELKSFFSKLSWRARMNQTETDLDDWTILAGQSKVAEVLMSSITDLSSHQCSMEQVLHGSRATIVSDPRDHVFALWSLTPFAADADEMIDYSKDAAWVFASTVKKSIIRTGSLVCLQWILHHKPPGNPNNVVRVKGWDPPDDLPSWVPDWSGSGLSPIKRIPLLPGLFQASCGSRADCLIKDDMREIRLGGLEIAEVRMIMFSSIYDTLDEFFADLKLNFEPSGLATACLERYGTAVNVDEAAWRTRLADTLVPMTYADVVRRWPKGKAGSSLFWRSVDDGSKPDGAGRQLNMDSRLLRRLWMYGRRMAISSQGHICLVPEKARLGDHICIFAGGQVPFIVRAFSDKEQGFFVGEAYVHGIMDGEA